MTLVLDRHRTRSAEQPVRVDRGRWIVLVAVLVAVLSRLAFLTVPPSPDEAGFLLVGGQWHAGGTSLYGSYWVDRPPLIIAIFQLASTLGGLPALRLLGALAVALAVLGSSSAAGSIAGARAARWAAVAAAALFTTPLLGTVHVNGELLASPFIAWSIAASVAALRADDLGRARLLAIGAGAAGMAALLVKQNFADGLVIGLVAIVIASLRGEVSPRHGLRIGLAAVVGAAMTSTAVAVMTLMHGTSLVQVFDATYPFRIAAGRVLATGAGAYATPRMVGLIVACAISGVALLAVVIVWGAASRRLRDGASWGLLAGLVFAVISVAAGGNYWIHYLVELIVPVAIITGVLVARHQPLLRPLVAVVVVSAVASWGIWLGAHPSAPGSDVGQAIAASAAPSDTIVVAYGQAQVVEGSGLSSPYPYLWSLPVKTLDPQLTELDHVLSGPRAPTWFVTWRRVTSWGLDATSVRATVRRDYHRVDRICGLTIYLHNDVTRPALHDRVGCPTKGTP